MNVEKNPRSCFAELLSLQNNNSITLFETDENNAKTKRRDTSTVIQNYKSVKERRAVINIGVLYETPQDKLKKITTIMEDVVEKDSKCRIDRAALKEFSQSSVDYELVFYAKVSSYKEFLKTNEKILFDIFEKFKENSIEFAYPTQTLHIKK